MRTKLFAVLFILVATFAQPAEAQKTRADSLRASNELERQVRKFYRAGNVAKVIETQRRQIQLHPLTLKSDTVAVAKLWHYLAFSYRSLSTKAGLDSLQRAENLDSAVACARKTKEMLPGWDSYMSYAYNLELAERWEEAVAAYNDVLTSQDPPEGDIDLASVRASLALCYEKRGDIEQAIKSFETARALNPSHSLEFNMAIARLRAASR